MQIVLSESSSMNHINSALFIDWIFYNFTCTFFHTSSFLGTFNSESRKIALHEQNLYLIESGKVTVRTFQVVNFIFLKVYTKDEAIRV